MCSVDTTIATNYYSGVEHCVKPRQGANLGGVFLLTQKATFGTLFDGFNRHAMFDKLCAPANTLYQRPTLMRDRPELDRQSCDEQTTPYATADVLTLGHHGGPDIVRRAEAAFRPTLPCFPSGKDTVASYPSQSGLRRNPVDPVGMAERLGVVTTDRDWW